MVCCCGEHYYSATESNAHTQTTDTQPTDGPLKGVGYLSNAHFHLFSSLSTTSQILIPTLPFYSTQYHIVHHHVHDPHTSFNAFLVSKASPARRTPTPSPLSLLNADI